MSRPSRGPVGVAGQSAGRGSSCEPAPAAVAEARVRLASHRGPTRGAHPDRCQHPGHCIPVGLIGYEYRPLSEPVYLGGIGERGLVAIATSGLFGRIGVDVASGRVVEVPTIESATASHVNRDIDVGRWPRVRRITLAHGLGVDDLADPWASPHWAVPGGSTRAMSRRWRASCPPYSSSRGPRASTRSRVTSETSRRSYCRADAGDAPAGSATADRGVITAPRGCPRCSTVGATTAHTPRGAKGFGPGQPASVRAACAAVRISSESGEPAVARESTSAPNKVHSRAMPSSPSPAAPTGARNAAKSATPSV